MAYVLLWAEGLIVALLCVALAAAWAVSTGSFYRLAGLVLVFLVFALLAAFAMHATAPWQAEWGPFLPPGWFIGSLSWLLVYLALTVLLLWQAFRRPAPGMARTGTGWSRRQLGLGLGGAVLALGLTFWNLDLAARTDLAVARQEAGDLLLTMSPPVAEADNAARLYTAAGKELSVPIRNPWHDAARLGLSAQPSEEVNWKDPYIVDLVSRQESVLALLRQAAALPPCSLDPHRSLDDFAYDSELAQRRWTEITLLAVDARVKAVQGERQRAFEDVAAILGTSRHVQTFLSGPEVLGTQRTAWRTLEDVLRLAPPGQDPLPAVGFPPVSSPWHILLREMAVLGMIWPAIFADDPLRVPQLREEVGPWGKPPLVYLTDSLVTPGCRVFCTPAELAYAHRKWEAYRQSAQAPAEGTPGDWAAVRALVNTGPAGLFSALEIKPKEKVLLRAAGQLAALEQLSRAGLAVARYRARHGRYPEHLEEVVPEFLPVLPVDPRDGQAVQMKRFAELTVLYTAESNGELAQATTWDPAKYRDQPVFRLYPGGEVP